MPRSDDYLEPEVERELDALGIRLPPPPKKPRAAPISRRREDMFDENGEPVF